MKDSVIVLSVTAGVALLMAAWAVSPLLVFGLGVAAVWVLV